MHVIEANLEDPAHQEAIAELTDAYARDPFGNGRPLEAPVRERLIAGLRMHPTTLVLLAYDGEQPVGIATCFRGFSTFAALPLLNIHDLAVVPSHRGRGIGKALLTAAEEKARSIGCCKLTLEVMANNPAMGLYESCGYAQAQNLPAGGRALFYSKTL